MKIEQQLKKLKSAYENVRPSGMMRASGWDVLRQRIETEEKRSTFTIRFVRYAIVTAGLVALISVASAGVVVASFRTSPGDFLYPVKALSERVATRFVRMDEETQEDLVSDTETETTGTPMDSVESTPERIPSRALPTEARETAKPVEEKAQGTGQSVRDAAQSAKETAESVSGAVQGVVNEVVPQVEIKIPSL